MVTLQTFKYSLVKIKQTPGVDGVYQFFLIGFVILIGFTGQVLFKKTKIPESLFLITFGLLIGPISAYFCDAPLVPVEPFKNITGLVTTISLIIILLHSGFEFDIFDIAKTFSKATFFTVTTFIMTTVFVSLFMIFVAHWSVLTALLLGVVSIGTTTVTVSHLITDLPMEKDVKQLLVLESIINDVTIVTGGVIITRFIVAEDVLGTAFNAQEMASTIFGSVLIAIAGGFLFFLLWFYTLDIIKESTIHFVYTVGLLFIMYDAMEFLNGSGPIAVLIFSLFVGNSVNICERLRLNANFLDASRAAVKSIKEVLDDFSFLVKTVFFVFLGIIFDPSLLNVTVIQTLAGILGCILVGRYISSKILAFRHRDFSPYSKIIAVMLPRGFTATVVAFLPAEEGVFIPGFTEIILLMVLVTTVIAIAGTAVYARTT